nr:DUF4251 domain-containing protein [uncultured Carboxylicivirga sp.]
MKTILSLLIIGFVGFIQPQYINSQNKKNKQEKRLEEFAETLKLVESGNFIFVPDRAFPQGGRSIDLTTNYGFLKIISETADSDMPYFGRAFQANYGSNDGGMKFKGDMIDKKMEINDKKKSIQFTFEVKDKDSYKVRMDISYGGSTSVGITSNNRSFISYNGKISELEEEEE